MRLFKRHDPPTPATGATPGDVKKAYEQGRHDERARHRSHPILGLIVAVAAVVGIGAVSLGAYEGSFSRAGQMVDQKLASATGRTQVASAAADQAPVQNDQQR